MTYASGPLAGEPRDSRESPGSGRPPAARARPGWVPGWPGGCCCCRSGSRPPVPERRGQRLRHLDRPRPGLPGRRPDAGSELTNSFSVPLVSLCGYPGPCRAGRLTVADRTPVTRSVSLRQNPVPDSARRQDRVPASPLRKRPAASSPRDPGPARPSRRLLHGATYKPAFPGQAARRERRRERRPAAACWS